MKIKLAETKSNSHWIQINKEVSFLIDYPTLEQEMSLEEIMYDDTVSEAVRRLRYARKFIKVTVKDWKGLEKPCKVVDNELEDGIWKELVRDSMQTLELVGVIMEKLKFGELDKKK